VAALLQGVRAETVPLIRILARAGASAPGGPPSISVTEAGQLRLRAHPMRPEYYADEFRRYNSKAISPSKMPGTSDPE